MKKEIEILQKPPPGISCWPSPSSSLEHFEAQIVGGQSTPYKGGVFHLDISIPERYPFEPPKVKFTTPIYHPNVDTAGRICLDLLKMPPGGSWKPSWNLSTLLTSVQLLMADPNPDDPLMVDIATEFKHKKPQFEAKAREWTQKYASETSSTKENNDDSSDSSSSESEDEGPCENQKMEQPRSKLSRKITTVKRPLVESNSGDEKTKKEKL